MPARDTRTGGVLENMVLPALEMGRDFYVGGGLQEHITHSGLVEILTLEKFVARANSDSL
jgi:hypothetical protein